MGKSIKCDGCGAPIVIPEGQKSAKCEYCGLVNFLPESETKHSSGNGDAADSLVRRAYILLEEGDFRHAAALVEQALNLEPENATAYIAQLMALLSIRQESELANNAQPLTGYSGYTNALRFGSEDQKARLEDYNRQILKRLDEEREATRRRMESEAQKKAARAKRTRRIWIIVAVALFIFIGLPNIFPVHPQPDEPTATLTQTAAPAVSQPTPTQSQPEDYLSSETTRDFLKTIYQEYHFLIILVDADMYIETSNPAETDSVFIIKEEAQAAEDAMYDVSVIADDSHNIIRYYYDGVESISSVDNLYPYIEDEQLTVLAGFTSSDSIHCIEAEIKDGDIVLLQAEFGKDAVREEVYNGFLEYIPLQLSDEDFNNLINADDPIIQFTGEDGTIKEYEISPQEIAALDTLHTVQKAHDTMQELCSQWEND